VAHSRRSGLPRSFRSAAVVAGRISCRVVRVFCSINSSPHTFCRLFLADVDITLKRFEDVTRICGHTPRQCFEIALSPDALLSATNGIIRAIKRTQNLPDTIFSVNAGEQVHCAFEVYPSLEDRAWIQCLVRPVSDWAFSQIMAEMDRRGPETVCRSYQRLNTSSPELHCWLPILL